MLIIKYDKALYEAKITELQGYWNQLDGHLATMKDLKKQMFEFWNDETSEKVGLTLSEKIRVVKSTMDQTQQTIDFYRAAVQKLEGSNIGALGAADDALSIVTKLGL